MLLFHSYLRGLDEETSLLRFGCPFDDQASRFGLPYGDMDPNCEC